MSIQGKMLTMRSLWVVALVVGLVCAQGTVAMAADGMQIEVKFGTGIDRAARALTGQGTEFSSSTENIFCYTGISGAEAPLTLTHAWYFKGKTKARVDLEIGDATWRTWSSKKIMPHWVGNWEVKVLDDAGQVLATGSFEIK